MATSAFGKAFRTAFDDGKTEFEFNGKKYSTKMKEEGSAPAKKAEHEKKAAPTKDTSNYSNEGRSSAAPADTSAPKKEYYRSLSGKMVEKAAPEAPDEEGGFLGKRMREALGSSYAKGGSVSSRADGIAQRGKTRGKMC
jgi:hypothetical protein